MLALCVDAARGIAPAMANLRLFALRRCNRLETALCCQARAAPGQLREIPPGLYEITGSFYCFDNMNNNLPSFIIERRLISLL